LEFSGIVSYSYIGKSLEFSGIVSYSFLALEYSYIVIFCYESLQHTLSGGLEETKRDFPVLHGPGAQALNGPTDKPKRKP
jgi:hypothetical protein